MTPFRAHETNKQTNKRNYLWRGLCCYILRKAGATSLDADADAAAAGLVRSRPVVAKLLLSLEAGLLSDHRLTLNHLIVETI